MENPNEFIVRLIDSQMNSVNKKVDMKLDSLYETNKQLYQRITFLSKEINEIKIHANTLISLLLKDIKEKEIIEEKKRNKKKKRKKMK